MRILIVGALPLSLVNFRGPLIKAMVTKGMAVCVAANGRDSDTEAKLSTMGVEYYPIRIARAGINPLADIITIYDLIRLMHKIKPRVVLTYTIKPVIYGGLAAKICGIKNIFSMIEGLGRTFMPWESLSQIIPSIVAKLLYRVALINSKRVFFLNPDDLTQFTKGRYVSKQKAVLLNGIGVDLAHYTKEPIPETSHIRFLMITRLLKDKGVYEYVEAARIIKSKYKNVEFILAGDLDDNPSSIKKNDLDSWSSEEIINHVGGFINDVCPLFRDSHVYVLPSFYREGTPRTVLEAMATGRAVITTDAPGCRETVSFSNNGSVFMKEENSKYLKVGRNGILVPIMNVEALVKAMEFFIKYPEQVTVMGKASRQYAEERYDVQKVNTVVLREMGLD